jgi:hypothetical protein
MLATTKRENESNTMSTTIVVKANAIATHLFRTDSIERKRPTITRLDAMRICANLEIDLDSHTVSVVEETLKEIEIIETEYSAWCDDVDSSRFDTPDDYNLSHVEFAADCQV